MLAAFMGLDGGLLRRKTCAAHTAIIGKLLEILWCSIMGQSFVAHSGDRKIVSKIVFALSISLVRCMAASAMAMLLLWGGGEPQQELSLPSTGE